MPRGVLFLLACLTSVIVSGVAGLIFRGSFLDGIVANAPLVVLGTLTGWFFMRHWDRHR